MEKCIKSITKYGTSIYKHLFIAHIIESWNWKFSGYKILTGKLHYT